MKQRIITMWSLWGRMRAVLRSLPVCGECLTGVERALSVKAMGYVEKYLVDAAGADSENVMAVWIADLDASVITQSDGYTSPDGWDITGRAWYSCIETGKTVLTEPYIDSSTGEIILSAATPIYDEGGNVLGAAGMDISLDHVTEVLSGYTIGSNGYCIL